MDLVYESRDLVPVISFDVTEAPYGADPTGRRDSTEAFDRALKDASRLGGTVFAPVGSYRIEGQLTVPKGVTLRGDRPNANNNEFKVQGTILLSYGNRANPSGQPFLTVDGGGVRDLNIYYPEQSFSEIVPYPITVSLRTNGEISNVTLVNPYDAVITSNFSTVTNLFAAPLNRGLIMLKATAVPRCGNVFISPEYWCESGLPNAPDHLALSSFLKASGAYGVQINRQDAGLFMGVSIDGYHTGVKVFPPHGWNFWHELDIRDCEFGIHFTGGLDCRMHMTQSRIFGRENAVLMQSEQDEWDPSWHKLRHENRKAVSGTERDIGYLRMFNCQLSSEGSNVKLDGSYKQTLNLQECTFERTGSRSDQYAVEAVGGDISIFDSEFRQASHHVHVNGRVQSLKLQGNTFSGEPDLRIPKGKMVQVDHTMTRDSSRSMQQIVPIPERLPAKTDADSLFVVTAPPYNAPADGKGDATEGIRMAIEAARENKGGTVYLPQGAYRLTGQVSVPAGVELRGANDSMPWGPQLRTLVVADNREDIGKPDNPPLILLESSEKLGGSGLAGLTFWYPNQDYRDIKAFPWTVRALGPRCWAQRIFLGNVYNGFDFATHNTDQHLIQRVSGSALNIGFFVGNTPSIGWMDNCHIRPYDWFWFSEIGQRKNFVPFDIPGGPFVKPTRQQLQDASSPYSLRPDMQGDAAITIGSGANAQITGFFTNGATRAFDFVDQEGTGGGNANILIGGSEAAWGAWIQALGDQGITMVNFSFSAMTRMPFVPPDTIPQGPFPRGLVMKIEPSVGKGKFNMIMGKFYGGSNSAVGVDMNGGDLYWKQCQVVIGFEEAVLDIKGGDFQERNVQMGDIRRDLE